MTFSRESESDEGRDYLVIVSIPNADDYATVNVAAAGTVAAEAELIATTPRG